MPSYLREENDALILKIGGSKLEFDDTLAKAKAVEGRRYNAADKEWEFPNDIETLLKVCFTIEPEIGTDLQVRMQTAKAKVAEELVTKLPDDAELMVPWASRLTAKQRAGVEFMVEHPHCLLCDEMGAGKTVQAITAAYEYEHRHHRSDAIGGNPYLVVCPNSVTGHWAAELKKWAAVESTILTGSSAAANKQLEELPPGVGWVIVNWEKLRLLPALAKINWAAVIADEAHRAKNRKAKQTKALWKLRATVQLALTGTPVMNNPGELWSVLKWLVPEQYTSYWKFFYNYTEYYDGFKGKPVVIGVKNPDSLRFELADKMIRRTKRDIHAGIPVPFPPAHHNIPMKPKQKTLYESALKDFWLEVVQEVTQEGEPGEDGKLGPIDRAEIAAAIESGNLETLKMMIPNAAARLTRCRQVATSPALLGGEDESGKLDAVIETITDAELERPFVVFAWYKGTVQLILDRLHAKHITARGFTGETEVRERAGLAKDFQAGDFQVFVSTIATGGTGIDLFRASDVLMAESDWVPASNEQAIARCDRMGQGNPVQARYFASADTVETGRIAPKLKVKQFIVDSILGAE